LAARCVAAAAAAQRGDGAGVSRTTSDLAETRVAWRRDTPQVTPNSGIAAAGRARY
jgi:hypothetical protein